MTCSKHLSHIVNLLGGFLFRILHEQADLLICLSIAGMATIAFAPWGDSLAYVVFFFWTAGTSEGILNVGGYNADY